MKRFVAIFLFTCACTITYAQVNFITTICGNGISGYNGDNILAINAELNNLEGICYDHRGNIYIADDGNSRVRRIELSTGVISTFAGKDSAGYSGDGGPATDAKLFIPGDVFADASGNIYIADGLNNRIRKVTIATGIITTVAGNGTAGSSGDGGLATDAELFQPCGICFDKFGNLYIADLSNFRVRKVDAVTGIITTIAGTGVQGYTGDNGPAVNAELASPGQVYADSSGNIFVVDGYNNAIRKIMASTGIISTIAGNGTSGYSGDGGPATNALLNQPYGIYIDNENTIFISEWGNGVIRRIDGETGVITTIAGDGVAGYSGDGGPATEAKLIPEGICFDDNGIMYIADFGNDRVRMVYNPLSVTTVQPITKISVYPNPAHDALIIEGAAGNEVKVINVLGREISKSVLSSNLATVDISGFANGVYMIQLYDPALMKTVTKKVVKE